MLRYLIFPSKSKISLFKRLFEDSHLIVALLLCMGLNFWNVLTQNKIIKQVCLKIHNSVYENT